jgi:hypothetical protein
MLAEESRVHVIAREKKFAQMATVLAQKQVCGVVLCAVLLRC